MKSIISIIICSLFAISLTGQSLLGAWEMYSTSDSGDKVRNVLTFSEGHQVMTSFDPETGAFIQTNGGSWKLEGDMITEVVEFNTSDSTKVGTEVSFQVFIKENEMGRVGADVIWKRIDNGAPGALAGAWLMSGRKRNGEFSYRDTDRPRKTMKILSGTRFQWIAYNTETKRFMGTGGGSYTTVDGKYTENIEFFSRDNTRVGASLEFDYDIKEGSWHHQGFSSKGAAMYEIWSQRK